MKKTLYIAGLFGFVLCASLMSCEDYLDREPNTTVSGSDAFKNFENYQGFVEEIINCIPDKEKCSWCPSWNWGDDEVFNPQGDDRLTHQIDLGNFRKWYQPTSDLGNWLLTSSNNPSGINQPKNHSLWGHAWYCIRKANMGLEHIDEMIGTDEEKNRILGQCYFYRAWWHFELMEWFGGLPYIDAVLDANNIPELPRLSFQECAARCAEDFRKAAELLPICWDSTSVKGQDEKNQLRANKITALCYKGKCQLWAASPLMEHGAQIGALSSGLTYDYNKALCDSAAETLGLALNLIETKANEQYKLANFDYSDIYNHVMSDEITPGYDDLWCYSDLFYTLNKKLKNPGGNEAIWRGPSNSSDNSSNWATAKVFGPKMAGLVAHDKIIHQPTANLVEMYGMANGLPIKDENGNYANGFDPTHPWKDRDPRFYHDIVFDGFKYLNGSAPKNQQPYVYCELFTGGNMRPVADGSQTGYFIQKLVPHTCNEVDKDYADKWGDGMHVYISYMRLADVYLMYAEACAAIGGATQKAKSFDKTAVDAVNVVRERCHCGPVGGRGSNANAKYITDNKLFMDEIRRERAVELSFEGFRFNDLQRWLLLTEYPYNTKYSVEFTRGESDDFYKFQNGEDPKDAKVNGYHLKPIITRNFGTKHYWFPFPDNDVYLYEGFAQNPGW